MTSDVAKHALVPKHSKLSDKEKEIVLAKYQINHKDLPKILISDPTIAKLDAKAGEVIKIERSSRTAGTSRPIAPGRARWCTASGKRGL
ncbi:MAG: DNA-directed RNA polymerase subunit RpoH/Rpb5 C-terminal domain-containing protein [Chloroflexota bacterium]